MALVTVGILASTREQLDLLQALVDATASAQTVLKEFPGSVELSRKIKEFKPQVLLIDIPPRAPEPALGTINLLRNEFPQTAIYACGEMVKRQVIVDAGRQFLNHAGAHHQLLADDVGVARRVAIGLEKSLGEFHV